MREGARRASLFARALWATGLFPVREVLPAGMASAASEAAPARYRFPFLCIALSLDPLALFPMLSALRQDGT